MLPLTEVTLLYFVINMSKISQDEGTFTVIQSYTSSVIKLHNPSATIWNAIL